MIIEDVTYNVNWKKFKKGTSFFIPCLDPAKCKPQVVEVLRRLKMKHEIRPVVEDGIKGLRVWRI